jgi:predicted RNA binding protein YcfA (HicA-like mRNA interferase family)
MKYDELIRLLNNSGWQKIRQRGSHIVMVHSTIQEQLIVPHLEGKEVKKGMLYSILKKVSIKTTKR